MGLLLSWMHTRRTRTVKDSRQLASIRNEKMRVLIEITVEWSCAEYRGQRTVMTILMRRAIRQNNNPHTRHKKILYLLA